MEEKKKPVVVKLEVSVEEELKKCRYPFFINGKCAFCGVALFAHPSYPKDKK